MTCTAGIDIGSGAVKTVLFRDNEWIAKRVERNHAASPAKVTHQRREAE